MPECYVTKRGYQLECDKPLHRDVAIFSLTYFLNDPHDHFIPAAISGYRKEIV